MAGCVALLAGAEVARAQVTFYGVQKTTFYTQTADSAPAAVTNYSAFGFVNTTNAGDATSFGGSNFYATKDALDQAFTAGDNYTFTAQGGSLDGESGELPIGADAYAPLLYLTGNGYSNAQSVNPGGGITFTLGSVGGEAASTGVDLSLYDTAGNQVYTADYAPGTTSIALSQATVDSLKTGEVYTAALDNFDTANVTATGDFANANDSDGFVTATNFTLEVVPEPGQTACLLTGLALMTTGWRVRRASVARFPSP